MQLLIQHFSDTENQDAEQMESLPALHVPLCTVEAPDYGWGGGGSLKQAQGEGRQERGHTLTIPDWNRSGISIPSMTLA